MKTETNKLKRAWIWFWYSELTRVLLILFPSYFIFLIPTLLYAGVGAESMAPILTGVYMAGFLWAITDNDFENLRRIGLDVYRQPLKKDLAND